MPFPNLDTRKFKDVSARLRSMIWYWLVISIAKVDDNELDRRYVRRNPDGSNRIHKYDRTRTFEQIRRHAVDPHWRARTGDSGRRSFSLVDRLKKDFAAARRAYRSELWRLLSKVAPTPADISAVIRRATRKLGLFRATTGVLTMKDALKGVDTKAFIRYPRPEYTASLERLAASATLDHVALLAALYLEALNETALDQAMEIRRILRMSVEEFIRLNGLPDLANELLRALIEERVIRRQWDLRPSPEERRLVVEMIEKSRPKTHAKDPITGFMIDSYYLLLYPRQFSPPSLHPVVESTKALKKYKPSSRQIKTFTKMKMEAYWRREWRIDLPPYPEQLRALQEFHFQPKKEPGRHRKAEEILD